MTDHECKPHMGTLEQAGEWANDGHQATYNALCEGTGCVQTFTLTLWRSGSVPEVLGTWTRDDEE